LSLFAQVALAHDSLNGQPVVRLVAPVNETFAARATTPQLAARLPSCKPTYMHYHALRDKSKTTISPVARERLVGQKIAGAQAPKSPARRQATTALELQLLFVVVW
jgi:hypothetical protein